MGELGAGSHSGLAENACKVRLDRLRAQKEPRGDVSIREAGGNEPRNLDLLRGQLVEGRRVAPPRTRTARPELGPCTLRPKLGADCLETLESCPQALARLSAALQSSQQLAVAELGSRALPAVRPALVPLERLPEVGFVAVQDAGATKELGDRLRPAGSQRC